MVLLWRSALGFAAGLAHKLPETLTTRGCRADVSQRLLFFHIQSFLCSGATPTLGFQISQQHLRTTFGVLTERCFLPRLRLGPNCGDM